MKIDIVPVEKTELTSIEGKTKVEFIKPAIVIPELTITLEDIFAQFLQLEVGDGAASADTIRSYLSVTKQYLEWCRDNLLSPVEAEPEDIRLVRKINS
jgi:integrase/recombinase XerD